MNILNQPSAVMMWASLVVVFFLLTTSVPTTLCQRGQTEMDNHFGELHHNQGVSLDALRKWFYKEESVRRKFPRRFPWCFNPTSIPSSVPQWLQTIMKAETGKEYDPNGEYIWKNYETKQPPGLIKQMEFKTVQVKRTPPLSNVFGGEEGRNLVLLKAWSNIKLEFSKPIRYAYVQSIGLPLGTPVGKFNIDFRCNDGASQDHGNYEKLVKVIPCQYAPKASYWWPNVFIMDIPASEGPVDHIQFRFQYTEAQKVANAKK